MSVLTPRLVLCNGAALPSKLTTSGGQNIVALEYREAHQVPQNVKISLPDFVRGVYHLPDRVLDLLELAAYIFAADRTTSRGELDDLEYHSWERSFHFVVRVRDYTFWSQPTVIQKLSEALTFMTGDREFAFTFQPGHATAPTSLFDQEGFDVNPNTETNVLLFSGGIDSLAGVIERLESTSSRVCLVSHQTDRPQTRRAQGDLVASLSTSQFEWSA